MAADPNDAVEFMREANDAESDNLTQAKVALRFRYGDQWPQYAINSRGLDRPQLTINETNTYIKKVTSNQRQQRPRGKASPVDSFADKKIAKVITGLGRHVEVNSDADNAYDTAFDFAATIGWGYWRVRTDYIDEKSFDQDVYIDVIDNPFTVSFDPNSKLPDGSDAEKALVTDLMKKEVFEKTYPGAKLENFNNLNTSDPDWITEQDIRIAEFFCVDRTKSKLVMLSDGTPIWADELSKIKQLLAAAGIGVIGERESFKRIVKWYKQTAYEILEEKTLPGRWIPIVPVYWTNTIIDGKRMRCGLVKDAMDPAMMNNFWKTAITESLALGPKAKWAGAEGFNEGHENEWKNANLSPNPVLIFKTTGVDGQPIPPPERLQPEPPPAGLIEAAFMATQDLSRVMGVFDPAVRGGAQHKSDKTLNAEQGQSENTNYEGYDNLTRSIKHSWRIMLSYFPSILDVKSVRRIIGEDGREEMVTLNEQVPDKDEQGNPKVDENGEAIMKVLNDVRVGTYDVVMETGPGYETARKEGVAASMQLLETPIGEKIAATADDLIVRGMDFPGSDLIADRLAAANPLSQIDEKSEIPPAIQMKMKGMEQMIKQLQDQLGQAHLEIKTKAGVQEIKEHGAIVREKMKQAGDKDEREVTRAQKQHDTETYALTAQHVAEINALARILTSKTEHGHRLREMLLQFQHEESMQENSLEVKSNQTEPEQQALQ